MITSRIQIKKTNGYALLFAVLVAAVVLGVGVSILNVSRKEILLTSGAEQSQNAFYAADAGYECAEYQDLVNGAFNSMNPGSFSLNECGAIYSGTTVNSYSHAVTHTQLTSGVNTSVHQFVFSMPVSNTGSCAAVTVTKTYTSTLSGTTTITTVATQILSDGFIVGWEASSHDCNAQNPTKVERALLSNY